LEKITGNDEEQVRNINVADSYSITRPNVLLRPQTSLNAEKIHK
jgi:hypothetical protein